MTLVSYTCRIAAVQELREDNKILIETKIMLEDQLATSQRRVETIIELGIIPNHSLPYETLIIEPAFTFILVPLCPLVINMVVVTRRE